eukprot:s274_g3.t1
MKMFDYGTYWVPIHCCGLHWNLEPCQHLGRARPWRGVNLGGWLLLEPGPSAPLNTGRCEWDLMETLRRRQALDILHRHRETFIQKEDFVAIKNMGLNAVRVRRIQRAVRAKALEALAVGKLAPGKELDPWKELISALDLHTVPWSQVPRRLKQHLQLPLEDRGIDSLALNLTVAVQAKDYGGAVPLTTFYFMAMAKNSWLMPFVKQLIVATNESTQLPDYWQQMSGAIHRRYTAEEIAAWRCSVVFGEVAQKQRPAKQISQHSKSKLKRWPHQVECLKRCRDFLRTSKRDFFVQMATGAGKSLVMLDLLAELGPGKRTCVMVPKLDLMEQMAQLLEKTLQSKISRVGTNCPADLEADIFVCVRNSAWQLQNVTLDLLLLDEAHHYEPSPDGLSDSSGGIHAGRVLKLKAAKRIFFTATLLTNEPDYDFGLRPAIEAGVIKDYTVMVPVVTEGDPRPSLVKLIQNLPLAFASGVCFDHFCADRIWAPLARKILAFCNTVHEATTFTNMLLDVGIAADHYNAQTLASQRQEILSNFQRREAHGGLRVLVTVDVLSEGVDLPSADTCLFVAPRRGIRLRQCVGRVLRKHPEKIDVAWLGNCSIIHAFIIAPPVVQSANATLVEDAELSRLLSDLATSDPAFESSLSVSAMGQNGRVGILTDALPTAALQVSVREAVARLLRVSIFPRILTACRGDDDWERGIHEFCLFKELNRQVLVPQSYAVDGFELGLWVKNLRLANSKKLLSKTKVQLLDDLGFIWDVYGHLWEQGINRLRKYNAEHGHVLVPLRYETCDGFKLGRWVNRKRVAKSKGRLAKEQIAILDDLGFIWDVYGHLWEQGINRLRQYKAEHGHVLVPWGYETSDGFRLARWVNVKRTTKSKGNLDKEKIASLDDLGFVWDVHDHLWEQGINRLQEYKAEHGHVRVPGGYETCDGFKLGNWVNAKRTTKSKGKLDKQQISSLDDLGFVWDVHHHFWDHGITRLQKFKAEHGHVLVPWSHETCDGFKLGNWVNAKRTTRSKGKLNKEQIASLDDLGFVWDVNHHLWEQGINRLRQYKAEHGHVLVPWSHETCDGFKLGRWVHAKRTTKSKGRLDKEQIAILDDLGFIWDVYGHLWEQGINGLLKYNAEHGHVLVPLRYETCDGFKLGRWVNTRRVAKSKGKLDKEQIDSLDDLGFVWEVHDHLWEQGINRLRHYKAEHGHVLVLRGYETCDGFKLGDWVNTKRAIKRADKLDKQQIASLDDLGFVWDVHHHFWDHGITRLRLYKAEHGHVFVPFGYWIVLGPSHGDPYEGPAMEYLDRAVQWAEECDLEVLLDLHGCPGGESPDAPCGRVFRGWDWTCWRRTETLQALEVVARRYCDRSHVKGLAVCNEPSRFIPADVLAGFYDQAVSVIRASGMSADRVTVVLPVFQRSVPEFVKTWERVSGGRHENFCFDVHYYHCFEDEWNRMTLAEHLRAVEDHAEELRRFPMVVGEWSLALGGRGKAALPASQAMALFARQQIKAYAEASHGWFFWNWRDGAGVAWDYRMCFQQQLLAGSSSAHPLLHH